MARKIIEIPNTQGGAARIPYDDTGTGEELLRQKGRLANNEGDRFHNIMMKRQPARGSKDGTVNSPWARGK
jgi:hypothetical protein